MAAAFCSSDYFKQTEKGQAFLYFTISMLEIGRWQYSSLLKAHSCVLICNSLSLKLKKIIEEEIEVETSS